ncbi:dna-directed rna polymerase ii subunit rpb1 [Cystoisospora suis]|uniref:Dna-directed rna polymerase ii subunit rpb1 n=1 Tax=Cystoisospora suis TaxID=483139 RepID=A0A2C6L5W1_9APIC|nr:dna-directed rna polymerase ii subunit rpb1 [Cystoisospora suis]
MLGSKTLYMYSSRAAGSCRAPSASCHGASLSPDGLPLSPVLTFTSPPFLSSLFARSSAPRVQEIPRLAVGSEDNEAFLLMSLFPLRLGSPASLSSPRYCLSFLNPLSSLLSPSSRQVFSSCPFTPGFLARFFGSRGVLSSSVIISPSSLSPFAYHPHHDARRSASYCAASHSSSSSQTLKVLERLHWLESTERPVSSLPWRQSIQYLSRHHHRLELAVDGSALIAGLSLVSSHRPLKHHHLFLGVVLHHFLGLKDFSKQIPDIKDEGTLDTFISEIVSSLKQRKLRSQEHQETGTASPREDFSLIEGSSRLHTEEFDRSHLTKPCREKLPLNSLHDVSQKDERKNKEENFFSGGEGQANGKKLREYTAGTSVETALQESDSLLLSEEIWMREGEVSERRMDNHAEHTNDRTGMRRTRKDPVSPRSPSTEDARSSSPFTVFSEYSGSGGLHGAGLAELSSLSQYLDGFPCLRYAKEVLTESEQVNFLWSWSQCASLRPSLRSLSPFLYNTFLLPSLSEENEIRRRSSSVSSPSVFFSSPLPLASATVGRTSVFPAGDPATIDTLALWKEDLVLGRHNQSTAYSGAVDDKKKPRVMVHEKEISEQRADEKKRQDLQLLTLLSDAFPVVRNLVQLREATKRRGEKSSLLCFEEAVWALLDRCCAYMRSNEKHRVLDSSNSSTHHHGSRDGSARLSVASRSLFILSATRILHHLVLSLGKHKEDSECLHCTRSSSFSPIGNQNHHALISASKEIGEKEDSERKKNDEAKTNQRIVGVKDNSSSDKEKLKEIGKGCKMNKHDAEIVVCSEMKRMTVYLQRMILQLTASSSRDFLSTSQILVQLPAATYLLGDAQKRLARLTASLTTRRDREEVKEECKNSDVQFRGDFRSRGSCVGQRKGEDNEATTITPSVHPAHDHDTGVSTGGTWAPIQSERGARGDISLKPDTRIDLQLSKPLHHQSEDLYDGHESHTTLGHESHTTLGQENVRQVSVISSSPLRHALSFPRQKPVEEGEGLDVTLRKRVSELYTSKHESGRYAFSLSPVLTAEEIVDCLNAVANTGWVRFSSLHLLLRSICNRTDDFLPEQKEDLTYCLQAVQNSLRLHMTSEKATNHSSRKRSSGNKWRTYQTASAAEKQTQDCGKRKSHSEENFLEIECADCTLISFFPDLRGTKGDEHLGSTSPTATTRSGIAPGSDASQLLTYLESVQKERILERKHRSLISWSRRKW